MSDVHDPEPRWTPDRWRAAEAVLDTLLDLPAGERRSHLRELSLDPELRSMVESLLDSLEADDDFLSGSVETDAPELFAELGHEMESGAEQGSIPEPGEKGSRNGGTPDRIGPWRILRPIGRGGMGTVHLAERADGAFEQQVAIKLLRRGLDTDDIVARFLSERQILADLDHPNIARLLDGGATEDGRPYIVMEYVDGDPIDAWCDRTGASLEARLKLLAEVCDAVAYAHRNLVVHRDLKPSNILVTDSGEPKVVDFGVAKLLEADGQGGATLTRSPLWTPNYAAPEQILGEPVTTATDVWGLGAVLYGLLTGRSLREIETPTPVALERAASEEPERPSEKASEERTGVSARRLRGDVDAIVTTATRAEPEERYAAPAELAADIRRSLDGRPVAAREPTRWYRMRKFVARRKLGVASGAAIVLLLIAYAVTVQVQSTRIAAQAAIVAEERDRVRLEAAGLRRMTGFWMNLFYPDALAPMGTRTAMEMLDLGVERANEAFPNTPELRSKTLLHLGRPAYSMGRLHTAEGLFERAVRINETSWHDHYDPRLGLVGYRWLGMAQHQLGEYGEAEANYHRALTNYADRVEPYRIPPVLLDLGWLYHETGDLDRAERVYREAVRLQQERGRTDTSAYAYALENLGLLFADRGDLEAAENLVRKALAIRSRYPPRSPHFPYTLRSLGRILYRQGETDTAERLLRTMIEMRRHRLGPDHWKFAEDLNALAVMVMGRGELVESRRLLERALEIHGEVLGEDHPVTAVARHQLATIHHRSGEREEAERLYGEAVDALSEGFGPGHDWTMAVLEDRGRLEERRPPAERAWLSGTRLPVPRTGQMLQVELASDWLSAYDD